MTGNQDGTARAKARLEQIYDRLDPMLDKAMTALGREPAEAGRCIGRAALLRDVELMALGSVEGGGRSPDRADALMWP